MMPPTPRSITESLPERVAALEARVEELREQRRILIGLMRRWMTDPDQQAVLDFIAHLEAEDDA